MLAYIATGFGGCRNSQHSLQGATSHRFGSNKHRCLSHQDTLASQHHASDTAYLFLIPIEVCLHAALCLKPVSKLIGRISTLVQVPRQIEGHKGLRVTVHSGHQGRLWYWLVLGGLICEKFRLWRQQACCPLPLFSPCLDPANRTFAR